MPGDTIGLRKSPWYAAPETDSELPTRMAATMRGKRMARTTASVSGLHDGVMERTLPRRTATTVRGETG